MINLFDLDGELDMELGLSWVMDWMNTSILLSFFPLNSTAVLSQSHISYMKFESPFSDCTLYSPHCCWILCSPDTDNDNDRPDLLKNLES